MQDAALFPDPAAAVASGDVPETITGPRPGANTTKTLSGQLRFAVRIPERDKRVTEVKRIVSRIMEIVE